MECVILLIRLLAGGLGCLAALWGGYYLVVGLMSWRCPVDCGAHPSKTRFAVLIAARNEEMVIGPLIQSLVAQNYPRELYHIWVIPNNCTDDTAGEARRWGAHVLNCTIPVKNKGEVLRFAYGVLAHKGYDAFCVFDADNLVHPDFLQEMNNAYLCGARAAQGYRDSKNPYDTVTSGCCSIYYWMMDRFHNGGHAALGLPAMINGTGFMIATSALEEMGGWSTRTISEDLELSALCTMAGIRVWWVPKARTFDEQPLSFAQSVRQRRRWSSGTLQVGERFLPRVWAEGTRQPSLPLADLGMTLLIPAYQLAMLASAGAEAVNAFMREDTIAAALACSAVALAMDLLMTALGSVLAAGLVISVEGKWDRRLIKALLLYWVFLLSWLPITVSSFWKKTTVWEEIRHTRRIAPEGLLSGK